jgi:Ca-activated chloride channel homolog
MGISPSPALGALPAWEFPRAGARLAAVNPARKRVARTVGCALALFASSGAVRAENLGTVTGTVLDGSTLKPIAGTVVTATSPQLIGKQVAVTDATGTYWLPQLPPGVYTLRLEAEQYHVKSEPDIGVNVDQTLRINAALIPASVTW